jgi:hypothetical protein
MKWGCPFVCEENVFDDRLFPKQFVDIFCHFLKSRISTNLHLLQDQLGDVPAILFLTLTEQSGSAVVDLESSQPFFMTI